MTSCQLFTCPNMSFCKLAMIMMAIVIHCECRAYMGLSLKEVPSGITLGAGDNELWFGRNYIHDVSSFPTIAGLEKLGFSRNRLQSFPNVIANKHSLRELQLGNNLISYINVNLLDQLRVLEELNLKRNRLTAPNFPPTRRYMTLKNLILDANPLGSVPAFGSLAEKLDRLSMRNCQINTILSNHFRQFSRLTELLLSGNPLKVIHAHMLQMLFSLQNLNLGNTLVETVPNFCHLKNASSLTVTWTYQGEYTPMKCDCHVVWGIVAGDKLLENATCAGSDHLHEQLAGSIALKDQVCDKMERRFDIRKVDPDTFSCDVPKVKEEIEVANILQCADSCAQRPGCMYFRLRKSPNGKLICGITDLNEGQLSVIDYEWYTLD